MGYNSANLRQYIQPANTGISSKELKDQRRALLTIAANLDPDSKEFHDVMVNQNKLATIGSAVEVKELRQALSAIAANLDPDSPEFQQVMQRQNELTAIAQQLNGHMILTQQGNGLNGLG
jgi:hypothetical protein